MEIKFTILAVDKENFAMKLQDKIFESLTKIAFDSTKILAIQFKDIDDFILDNYLDSFRRIDGQYSVDGKFWYYRDELSKIIKPYCKTCSISIAEKDLGNKGYSESEKERRFGYINFAEYYVEQPTIKEWK